MKTKSMNATKSNDSDLIVERQPQDQLPELAVRILSDVARIVAAEARLLESNIVGAAQTLLGQVYLVSTLIVLAAAGVVALLASLVLLLHHWMPYWQVLGVVGVGAVVLAELLRRSLMPATVNIA